MFKYHIYYGYSQLFDQKKIFFLGFIIIFHMYLQKIWYSFFYF
jgi:hypothetical protein